MKYVIHINKRIRDVRVYEIKQRLIKEENFMTKLFMKIFNPKKKEENGLPTAQLNK